MGNPPTTAGALLHARHVIRVWSDRRGHSRAELELQGWFRRRRSLCGGRHRGHRESAAKAGRQRVAGRVRLFRLWARWLVGASVSCKGEDSRR